MILYQPTFTIYYPGKSYSRKTEYMDKWTGELFYIYTVTIQYI
jgi:hypothetical protein